jgi:superfamily I DNA/RNA helicase
MGEQTMNQVEEVEETPSFWDENFTADDAILCRNMKPLVQTAYSLLRKGIACKVEGRDIGNGLIQLARKWKVTNLTTLADRVEGWKERETQKWQAKGKEAQAAAVEDKAETIICIIEMLIEAGKTKVEDLVNWIKGLFSDTPDGEKAKCLTLCTIHRSKGREWQRVYWLRPDLCPSKWARTAWQMDQERNLMYVAVTRSMGELIRVEQ